MSLPKTPRFTDAERHPHPYVPSEQTKKEGYLREKWLKLYPGCFDHDHRPEPIIEIAK